jgi:hypothetical protein
VDCEKHGAKSEAETVQKWCRNAGRHGAESGKLSAEMVQKRGAVHGPERWCAKSEIRNPKAERNPKSEIRNPKSGKSCPR